MKYNITIIENNKAVSDGFKAVLKSSERASHVDQVDNIKSFLEKINHKTPDIAFVDVDTLANENIGKIKKILKDYPDLTLITFLHEKNDYLENLQSKKNEHKLIDSGLQGFIMRFKDVDKIEKAIDTIMNNKDKYPGQMVSLIKNKIEK